MPRPSRSATAAASIVLALSVAGCSGGPSPAASATARPTAAAVTSEPRVASAEPTAPALSETFTAVNGRTIAHPAGWWTKEDMGIVYLASSEDTANALVGTGSLTPGQVYVQFGENSIVPEGPSDPAIHLPDHLRFLLEGAGLTAGAPTTFTVGGKPAARIDAANNKLQIIAVSVKVRGDLFADVIAYGAPGEEATLQPLVLRMVDSLTYPAT